MNEKYLHKNIQQHCWKKNEKGEKSQWKATLISSLTLHHQVVKNSLINHFYIATTFLSKQK